MTNEQILKKAIEKAIKNGWGKYDLEDCDDVWFYEELEDNNYYSTIFSHDFAKAFWGEEYDRSWSFLKKKPTKKELAKDDKTSNELGLKRNYEWALQEMVLEKDPLNYIKKFL